MSEYAYISKDESYAIKHYGVKGMKWRKRLKKKIEKKIGLNERKKLEEVKTMGEDIKNRRGNSPYSNSRTSVDDQLYNIYKKQIPYRASKYSKTKLAKMERQSKIGKIAVNIMFGKIDKNVKKKFKAIRSRRNSKVNVSYADNEIYKKYAQRDDMAKKGIIGYRNNKPMYKKGTRLWNKQQKEKKSNAPKAKQESFIEKISPRKRKEKQIRQMQRAKQRSRGTFVANSRKR